MANPFDSDEEYQHARKGLGLDPVKSYTNNVSNNNIEDQVAEYEREIEKYMQMSLDSTQRSCQQLESSEQHAQSAARELIEQREKLERAENNLDQIDRTAQITQRSLNSLKSLFGGMFKNKFSRLPKEKSKDEGQQANSLSCSKSADQLGRMVDNSMNNKAQATSNGKQQPTLNAASRAQISGTRWEAMDNQIDQNLDQMSSQLSRLRTWGNALGEEVDDQNLLLDRIQTKTERNDTVVRNQESQMRKLLG